MVQANGRSKVKVVEQEFTWDRIVIPLPPLLRSLCTWGWTEFLKRFHTWLPMVTLQLLAGRLVAGDEAYCGKVHEGEFGLYCWCHANCRERFLVGQPVLKWSVESVLFKCMRLMKHLGNVQPGFFRMCRQLRLNHNARLEDGLLSSNNSCWHKVWTPRGV